MSERAVPARLRPRDAASLIIVDRTGPVPRVLMGRRHPGQVFLPDTFVFPGGRVETDDRTFARRHTLPSCEIEILNHIIRGRPSETRAVALALAAVRETFEETGFVVGTREPSAQAAPTAAREPASWQPFVSAGFRPRLDTLTFFARAITPPKRPRRYDTRFFITERDAVAHHPQATDGELLDIGWFTLDEARTLNLPSITRHIIEDIQTVIGPAAGTAETDGVPFYRHRYGRLERTLLPRLRTHFSTPGRNAAPGVSRQS